MKVTEAELSTAGYKLKLWNNGTVRRWVKEPNQKSFVWFSIEQEWQGGEFILSVYLGRVGGIAVKMAGIENIHEAEMLYALMTKGTAVSVMDLFKKFQAEVAQ